MQQTVKFPTAITPNVRKAVFASWKGCCAYCPTGKAEHVDHITPKAHGGPDALENYVASCQRCNLMKSDLMLAEGFIHILQAKAARRAPKVAAKISSLERKTLTEEKKQALRGILARDRFLRAGVEHKHFQDFELQVSQETEGHTLSQIKTLISQEKKGFPSQEGRPKVSKTARFTEKQKAALTREQMERDIICMEMSRPREHKTAAQVSKRLSSLTIGQVRKDFSFVLHHQIRWLKSGENAALREELFSLRIALGMTPGVVSAGIMTDTASLSRANETTFLEKEISASKAALNCRGKNPVPEPV